jgi:tetratricopeptide (TPR) repeat protein
MYNWMKSGLLFALIAVASCGDKADSKQTGEQILQKPPYAGLTDSIKQFPEDVTLYERRGLLLSQNNVHDLATADYRQAWKMNATANNGLLYASGLLVEGKQDEMVKLLNSLVEQFPENTEIRRRLSETYIQLGKPDKALEQYNAILRSDSSNFEAWYEKASISAQARDTPAAIQALENAYRLQPMLMYGISLANLYAETKNSAALALCDVLLAKDSLQESGDPFFVKGIYYANVGQTRLALEQFENCIKRDWKFTDAYIEKGIILFNEKNIDEALKTFALASRVSNTNPDAYYWQGRCYEISGRPEDARDNYLRAYMLDRSFTEAKSAMERIDKKQK